MEGFENIIAVAGIILIFILLIAIGIYVAMGIFLNKFNKLVYGKGTPMAWIPFANIYLLGKLAFNKIVGWVLVIALFFTGSSTVEINGVQTTRTAPSYLSNIYSIAVIAILIYAIVKYSKMKKEKALGQQPSAMPQQEVNPQPVQPVEQPVMPVEQNPNPQVDVAPVAVNPEPTPNVFEANNQVVEPQPIQQPEAVPATDNSEIIIQPPEINQPDTPQDTNLNNQ